jgi:transposase
MEKEDARYQRLEQLHERRKQVVRLHLRCIKVMQITQMTGLSYPTVRKAIDLYTEGGWAAIKPASRGRAMGEGRMLSADQEVEIQHMIGGAVPMHHGVQFSLWNRMAVKRLIEQKFGINMTVRTTGDYLRRWGIAVKKTGSRSYMRAHQGEGIWINPTSAPNQPTKNQETPIRWKDSNVLVSSESSTAGYAQ